MTEFEKIALHYLAHQSQCLHWICRESNSIGVPRSVVDAAQKELEAAIRREASPGTLQMLGAPNGNG
jgi:hypothetical protein